MIEGGSLLEFALDVDRPPISVSATDYERIAHVVAARCTAEIAGGTEDPMVTQATRIREGTADAELTAPMPPRLVSLTHVCICLRFWKADDLVRRQSGGWFRPTAEPTEFVPAAVHAWRQRAGPPSSTPSPSSSPPPSPVNGPR